MYPEQRAALERDDLAVKNVCKHLWLRLYGKQADRLQTDNRVRCLSRLDIGDCCCCCLQGNYVIHDYAFAPIEEMVKAGVNYNDVDATPPHVINRIEQTLELPKGVSHHSIYRLARKSRWERVHCQIIAGYLSALGHPCYVGYFDITEAPVIGGCCFKVTMATDQQPTTRDSVDSPIENQKRP